MSRKEHQEITKNQVMEFIQGYIADNGIAPSVREICQGVGLSSTSVAYRYINLLKAEGRLHQMHGKNRALVLHEPNCGQIPVLKRFQPNLFDTDNIDSYLHCFKTRQEKTLFSVKAEQDNQELMIMRNDIIIAEYGGEIAEDRIAVFVTSQNGFDFCRGTLQRENTIGSVFAVVRIIR